MVLKNNSIHSHQIEVSAGDIINFSFSGYGNEDYTTIVFFIKLTDGTSTVYAQRPGDIPKWKTTTGSIQTTVDANEWFNVDIPTGPVPFDGILTVYLNPLSIPTSDETLYRDMRLEVIYSINQSTKVIGHTHTSSQGGNIKLNEDEEIFIDSSPRNSIAGTLFRETMN